ncbi:multiple epidermal growth factor-like domains protein 6 isoform X3 [Mytilus californianus]|uniref:multiple epidermal growth factor-like domains protein 6 isoform X3 n=1 Tax=Mytilus californianus TaxID=6549 RepID=UPI002247A619|nr:multiple epidermal growth factor-like domains protein 6 isoform X3 [Mytilus californianus]
MKMISKLQTHIILIMIQTCMMTVTAQINLALHGRAEQDTTYKDGAGISYNANLAIEGPANNNWNDGCSSTAGNQSSTWWGLLLPKLAYITSVQMYLRNDVPTRMNDFRLYLSNGTVYSETTELCYRDIKKQAYLNLNRSIDCDNSPSTNVYFFNRYTFIQLCYIEIYGCWKGFWGEKCAKPCPPKCIDQHCYPTNGTCIWGCDPKNCMSNTCYSTTGVCFGGCVLGRAGQYCNKYNLAYNQTAKIIPVGQTNARLSVDGLISTCNSFSFTGTSSYLQVAFESLSVITTVHFVFGDKTTDDDGHTVYCSNTTDTWNDGTLLYRGKRLETDINVFVVCIYLIYVPPMLNGDSLVELCEIEIGGCPLGRYGINCKNVCHCNGPYDLITGNCTFGCLDGWIGYRCDIACSSGMFGNQCREHCSANCLNPPCNHVSGKCNEGCNRGWEKYNCTKECDIGHFGSNCSQTCLGCISNMCDKVTGRCTYISACKPGFLNGEYCNQECDDWYFGINCAKKCNCRTTPCNKFDGTCSVEECERGWHGASCDEECTNGYFGFSCKIFCETCFNHSCDIMQGNCRAGCIDGYRGRTCTMMSGISNVLVHIQYMLQLFF